MKERLIFISLACLLVLAICAIPASGAALLSDDEMRANTRRMCTDPVC